MFNIVYRSTLGMRKLFLDYYIAGNTFTTQGKSITNQNLKRLIYRYQLYFYIKLLVCEWT
jgi:hypothetical protein